VIHLHARKEDGTPTQDVEIFSTLIERIREAGCEAILNVSTGSAAGHVNGYGDRIAVLSLDPEMATLDCGSLNIGDTRVFSNPYSFLREAALEMRDRGIVPEIEAFDAGMIENGLRLIDGGAIPSPGVWQICVGVRGGAPGDLQTVSHLVHRLPEGAEWALLGVGRHQIACNLLSLAYGGHVRTGLEDNVYYRPGELATGNVQLVERVVKFANEVGRPIASPAEARELLGTRGSE
jgi:3-keto-5-aminohexanoate cleavage enzyme